MISRIHSRSIPSLFSYTQTNTLMSTSATNAGTIEITLSPAMAALASHSPCIAIAVTVSGHGVSRRHMVCVIADRAGAAGSPVRSHANCVMTAHPERAHPPYT